jgi:hypothetical protein
MTGNLPNVMVVDLVLHERNSARLTEEVGRRFSWALALQLMCLAAQGVLTNQVGWCWLVALTGARNGA